MKITKWVVLVALLVGGSAQASIKAWVGNTPDWSNAANWFDGVTGLPGVPGGADDVYFDTDYSLFGPVPAPTALPTINSLVPGVSLFIISPFNATQVTIVNGGSITVGALARIGHGDLAGGGATGTLNMTGGSMIASSFQLGYNENNGTNSLVSGHGIVNLSGSAVLHAGSMAFGQEMAAFGFDVNADGAGQLNMTDSALFLVNGDITGSAATWVGTGMISATGIGESISYSYNGIDDRTEFTVVPEPATFGLFALMGGGMLWVRKRFRG